MEIKNEKLSQNEINQRIEQIIQTFDMGAKAAAKAMGVTAQTFRLKKSDKAPHHWFNEKNLTDLITYIKAEAEKL